MRMHQVVVQLIALDKLHHAAGKCSQLRGQFFLAQALIRPSNNINDAQVRLDVHDFALAGTRRAGENIHVNTHACQLRCNRQHVDIHPAGIA